MRFKQNGQCLRESSSPAAARVTLKLQSDEAHFARRMQRPEFTRPLGFPIP